LEEIGGGEDLAKVTDANVDAILEECISLVSQHDQVPKFFLCVAAKHFSLTLMTSDHFQIVLCTLY
jgi:hypothetical protein